MYMINKEINTEKLFAENKRYVELVAKQYQNKGLTMEQLIKEGNEGLLAAAKFFDESRGIFFLTMLHGGFVRVSWKRWSNMKLASQE